MADIDEMLIDRRVLHRSLRKGIVERKEYEAYLEGLPDREDNVVVLQFSGRDAPEHEDGDPQP